MILWKSDVSISVHLFIFIAAVIFKFIPLMFQAVFWSCRPLNLTRVHLLETHEKCFENQKNESFWRINKQFKYKCCVVWLENIRNLTLNCKIDRGSRSLFLSFFLTKYIIKNVMEYNNWWLIFPCSKILWFSVPLRMTLLLSKVSLQFFDT